MTTDALIRELVAGVRPVRPVGRPLMWFAAWTLGAAVWIAAGVVAFGVRADLAAASRAPGFVLQVIVPLAVGLVATGAAFAASIPGRGNRWWSLILVATVAPLVALVVWGGALAASGGHVGHVGHVEIGARCIRNLLLLSVPPGLLLCLMLRKAAPLDRGTVGVLAALGTSALAQVGTRFLCHHDSALHILVWHYSFVFVVGAAGLAIGRALFR